MARTKGRGAKASRPKPPSPSPERSPSPPSPPPKTNSPSSSSSAPLLTPPSSFMQEATEPSSQPSPASSPERSSTLKTLFETNPLAIIVHPSFLKNLPSFTPEDDPIQVSEVVFEDLPKIPTKNQTAHTKPQNPKTKTTKSDPIKAKTGKGNPARKTKSSQTIRTRRSQRLISGFGTCKSQIKDTNVYEIKDSDEEDEQETRVASETIPTTSPQKTPPKPPTEKPTPKDKGKGKALSGSTEKVPPKKRRVTTQNINISVSPRIPFMEPEDYEIFKDRWACRPVVVGRYFDFAALASEKIMLKDETDCLGWTKFLQTRERHYPKMVQAFFCQAKGFAEKSLIISTIKGIKIELTPEKLGKILSLPIDGNCVYGDDWSQKLSVNLDVFYKKIFIPGTTEHVSANLLPIPKMFHNMCQYNIFPRKGSFENISKNDFMVIYHAVFKERLNLPFVLIQHMIATSKTKNRTFCLPYGMLLSLVFIHFKIPLENEPSIYDIQIFNTKNIKHMKKDSEEFSEKNLKRKREESGLEDISQAIRNSAVLSAEQTPDRSPVLEEHGVLLSNFQTQAASFSALDASNVLQSFTAKSITATRVSKFSQLFISPPKPDMSALFKPDSVSKFFNQQRFESSVPMSSFRTLQSTCPPFNTDGFRPTQTFSTDKRPPKRSKLEKDASKIRADIRKVFENQAAMMNHMSFNTFNDTVYRNWIGKLMGANFEVPPPFENPFAVPVYKMQVPDNSSSSDASSPTAPSK
ncbi:hypothetical protein MTR_8g078850 [Medicago truncatula]|uniref:Putative plant transposon protein domain-containing protein n=1 Tax=Medicago truncatula TaxID=3880 RepID=G7ZVI5_MEDTR|nr:hypothetical protein MTR_8g078850 [Medicago truncatula]